MRAYFNNTGHLSIAPVINDKYDNGRIMILPLTLQDFTIHFPTIRTAFHTPLGTFK